MWFHPLVSISWCVWQQADSWLWVVWVQAWSLSSQRNAAVPHASWAVHFLLSAREQDVHYWWNWGFALLSGGWYQLDFIRAGLWDQQCETTFCSVCLTLDFCLSCSKMWASLHTNCWTGWKMHSSSLWMSSEFFKIPGVWPVTEEKQILDVTA